LCFFLILLYSLYLDRRGETPLHLAVRVAKDNSVEVVKMLLEVGSDYMAVNSENRTPLQIAKDSKKAGVVKTIEDYLERQKIENIPEDERILIWVRVGDTNGSYQCFIMQNYITND